MKSFLKALALATALSTLGVVAAGQAFAADKVCAVASKEEFLKNVKPVTKKSVTVPSEMLTTFLSNVNEHRKQRGIFLLEADEMMVGQLTTGKIGVVLLKNGCVIPGTVHSLSSEGFLQLLKEFKSEKIMSLIGLDA